MPPFVHPPRSLTFPIGALPGKPVTKTLYFRNCTGSGNPVVFRTDMTNTVFSPPPPALGIQSIEIESSREKDGERRNWDVRYWGGMGSGRLSILFLPYPLTPPPPGTPLPSEKDFVSCVLGRYVFYESHPACLGLDKLACLVCFRFWLRARDFPPLTRLFPSDHHPLCVLEPLPPLRML